MEHENSPYYRGNREEPPTTLILKTGNTVITQELPWDVNIRDLIHAFYTACIGITFGPDTVLECMKNYVEENLSNNEDEHANED